MPDSSSSDCSSSDESIPLNRLIRTKKNKNSKTKSDSSDNGSNEEYEFNDSVEDETNNDLEDSVEEETDFIDNDSISSGSGSGSGSGSDENDDESDDDYSSDDSDDNRPVSSLKTKVKVEKTKVKVEKTKVKVEKTTKSPRSATKKKASVSKKKIKKKPPIQRKKTATLFVSASSELYSKSVKGRILQAVLCRWWYALTWPDPKCIPACPPDNYDALDGFPGVYICFYGDDVGKILDLREKKTCPNFDNFSRKGSEELRDILLKAIQNQRKALISIEGEGTDTETELNVLEKWAKKINITKADKEANKVMKAAGFSLN